jgi:hypothetical protein
MPEQMNHIIGSLKSRWRTQALLSHVLMALSVSFILITLTYFMFGISFWWSVLFFITTLGLLLWRDQYWKISEHEVSRVLNKELPELQESSALLLKPQESLGFLESLQVKRITQIIDGIEKPEPAKKKLRIAAILFPLAILACFAILQTGISSYLLRPGNNNDKRAGDSNAGSTPKLLPVISSLSVRITPPSYTGRPSGSQENPDLKLAAGSEVVWEIKTNTSASEVELLMNDSLSFKLRSRSGEKTSWTAEKKIIHSGFYQFKIDGKISEYYKIESIADAQPLIVITSPGTHSSIDFGQKPETKLLVNLSDDYGIREANIIATIASGQGEAVKFKEQKISFSNFSPGKTQYRLQKLFELTGMGMVAGDELYFYISATDNFQQESRSDIYTVKIEDTAELMSMEGLASGIDLKPEFFRSQRQIIIETELLLKSKGSLSEEAFKNKSNDLGIDQKLLRLRYGKFLGEEAETVIGDQELQAEDEREHENPLEIKPDEVNSAEKIIEPYTHKHDIAEDASFFDPATKKQLKATLAEMWEAESRLRTLRPADALPYEYKALRLLKELQQQSRAYVAKTNIKTAPLKADKRLTGDLSAIVQPTAQKQFPPAEESLNTMRKALGILEQLKTDGVLSGNSLTILDQAHRQLGTKATSEPGIYLSSFEALKNILAGNITVNNIRLSEKAFQKMLDASPGIPYPAESSPGHDMSKEYFINLKKTGTRQ